jgi:NMD protein affecting ribosome stability and mRNA decay
VTGPVATIEMTIAGQRVALHVCSRCDARRWRTRWGVVPLTEVLSMI